MYSCIDVKMCRCLDVYMYISIYVCIHVKMCGPARMLVARIACTLARPCGALALQGRSLPMCRRQVYARTFACISKQPRHAARASHAVGISMLRDARRVPWLKPEAVWAAEPTEVTGPARAPGAKDRRDCCSVALAFGLRCHCRCAASGASLPVSCLGHY